MMLFGLALSLFIGLALGLFGGGGSILAVPILTYTLGLSPKAAIAASLVIIGVTSGVALVSHWRSGRVCLRTGAIFGGASVVGAYVGGRVAHYVSDTALLTAFGVMMLVTAVAMLRGRRGKPRSEPASGTSGARNARLAALGAAVGVVTGLVGAGGGFLIVPALVLIGRMPIRRAIVTSLLVITANSFAGLAGHLGHIDLAWRVVVPVTVLAVLGSLLGSQLGKRVRQESLRQGFAWLVMAVAVFVVARQLPALLHGSTLALQTLASRLD